MKQSVFVRRWGRPGLVPLLLWMLAGGPEAARAQWVEAPGEGWVQVAVYHHDTRRRFDEQGRTRRLFNEGGRSLSTSVFVTAVAGLVRGLDVWGQVPFHRLAFNDVADERTRTGFGDVRLHGRIGPSLFGLRRARCRWPCVPASSWLPATTRGTPRSSPWPKGQRDGEVLLELGHSFWPRPLYLSGWFGYRWREENEEAVHKPGDELFYFVTLGGHLGALHWKLSLDGLHGRTPRFLGLAVPSSRRRLVQLLPSLGRPVGPGVLELGARIPISGRNLPAGPALLLGCFWTWGR
ncbi:MAG: hypothetical protein KatS3mg042_0796 [Rhodothermaceae bacterium]|nr:MAG: hypothetical protein KatS3mg042_0796 [Rhodothermaceae bacterium]